MRSDLLTRFVFVALVCAAFSSAAAAQSPSKILSNAEKAFGGAKALRAVQSVRRTGTIVRENDGLTGTFTDEASRPGLYRIAYSLEGFEYESAYNGRSAWSRDSRDGLRTLTGDEGSDFQSEALFRSRMWLERKAERARITAGGRVNINERPANVVIYTTATSAPVRLFFDAETNLLVREERRSGDELKTIDYADYRASGAAKFPHKITVADGNETLTITLDTVHVNPQIARTAFDFPPASGEPLPDITALLREVQENEDRVETILDTYSFTQTIIKRELQKNGILRETGSETFDLAFHKGNRIRRMVARNGRPLTEREQAAEDRDVEKQIENIERDIARKEAREAQGRPSSDDGSRVSIAEVMRASRLVNPRRERFRGRDVIVFDFEPNPDFDYKNAESVLKFFGKTAGVMWIDEQDKQVARLEAYLADSFNVGGGLLAKLRKGASFTLDQQRVNDEIWLPSRADIDLSVRVLLVRGLNFNQVIRSSNYKKFTTDVQDSQVGDSPPPYK